MTKKQFLDLIRKEHLTIDDVATNPKYYKYYIQFKKRGDILDALHRNEDLLRGYKNDK